MPSILDKSEQLKTEDNLGLYVMRIFHDYYDEISGLKPNDLKDEQSIKELTNNYLSNVLCLSEFVSLEGKERLEQLKQIHDLKKQLRTLKENSVRKREIKSLKKDSLVAELAVKFRYKNRTGVKIGGSLDAANVLFSMWNKELISFQEQFNVLYLNRGNEVIGFRNISTGTLSSNIVDINLIISLALQCRASSIIISHNHPSGTMQASNPDIKLTKKIKAACKLLNIALLDHIILSPHEAYMSFADEELL